MEMTMARVRSRRPLPRIDELTWAQMVQLMEAGKLTAEEANAAVRKQMLRRFHGRDPYALRDES
jgi:hypothetical protein